MTHYYHHYNGLIFVIFSSSHTGFLNVSLNCGSREFLGYVKTMKEAIDLVESKF